MTENKYICLNGEFRKTSEASLFTQNRAFRYGDVLHEDLHAFSTELQFPGYHLERLLSNMQLCSMEVPVVFSVSFFTQLASQLLNKNRIFGGAGIRLSVYRDVLGDLIPDSGKVAFIIESRKLENDHYKLNDKGLNIDLCAGYTKSTGSLAAIRDAHALLYILAALESRKRDLDQVILLNEAGRMVETQNSNIFLVSGNAIFTPGVSQGCVPGVMRRVVLELAGDAGLRINDQSSLTPAALEDAEELFISNALDGIQWIVAYRERRYYKRMAKILNEKLNERAFP